MVRNIGTFTLDSWSRIEEYVERREDWFIHTKDNPVLSCVTTIRVPPDKYYCTVNFYRRASDRGRYHASASAA